jgi:hypothetical protein
MNSFPPFFNINDDIDNLLYYTFEIPNYYKLFDFINAIITVFNIKIADKTKINIIEIFSVIKTDSDKLNNFTTNKIKPESKHKQESKDVIKQKSKPLLKPEIKPEIISESQGKLDIENEIIEKRDLNLVRNNNAFIELNIENSENYALNTDIA